MDIFHFFSTIPTLYKTAGLLILSNLFMSFAWYGHLKNLAGAPLWVAIISSWGVAFFEYTLMIPANRIGFTSLSLGQLKILQEVVSLSVFIPFAIFYMKEPIKLDYLWASLCILGAAYFMFRDKL